MTKLAITYLGQIAEFTFFILKTVKGMTTPPYRVLEWIRHVEFVGNRSVVIILLTGIFTGLALSFQVYLGFRMVNATNLIGPVVALGITRELGPVLTGLLVAARAGGAMAARLGTMRVTEQIDALQVMGINPFNYLVAPRVFAGLVATPLLTILFDFSAIMASWFLVSKIIGLDAAVFWHKIQSTLKIRYIFEGLFKSIVFGLVFSLICSFFGYTARGGAKGVGEATNQGVVYSMVTIICIDYVLMNLLRVFYFIVGISD